MSQRSIDEDIMKMSPACYGILVGCALLIAGCGGRLPAPSPADAQPPEAWLELRRTRPELRSYRNSILLDFEQPTDRVFVTAGSTAPAIDTSIAHSGSGSLQVRRASHIDVKLSSLMSGRELPGEWALLGAYVRSDRQSPMQVQYLVDGSPVLTGALSLAAGEWTPVMLDITSLPQQTLGISQTAVLRFATAAPADLSIDDLMLIDNSESIVDDDSWSISQIGHALAIEHAGQFRVDLAMDPAAPDGWTLIEAGRLRAIVAQGPPRSQRWVIYRDGRRYANGSIDRLADTAFDLAHAEQHRAPAEITIPQEQGSLHRRSAGDANNDGYNETLGAHLITATKSRIEIHISPRTPEVIQPVFEIRGLPEGRIIATLEGQLIDEVDRLEDGTVLVIPPQRIQRPATLNVRIQ